MKYILFPTKQDADSFIAEVQQRGVAHTDVHEKTFARNGVTTSQVHTPAPDAVVAEEAGEGAVSGTVAGAATGAIAGVIGTAATVATGGLALPVILGMAALGSGVGAAVGATGGAVRAEERYELDDDTYNSIESGINTGGRVVAIDDNVPYDVAQEVATKYGGRFVSAQVAQNA